MSPTDAMSYAQLLKIVIILKDIKWTLKDKGINGPDKNGKYQLYAACKNELLQKFIISNKIIFWSNKIIKFFILGKISKHIIKLYIKASANRNF